MSEKGKRSRRKSAHPQKNGSSCCENGAWKTGKKKPIRKNKRVKRNKLQTKRSIEITVKTEPTKLFDGKKGVKNRRCGYFGVKHEEFGIETFHKTRSFVFILTCKWSETWKKRVIWNKVREKWKKTLQNDRNIICTRYGWWKKQASTFGETEERKIKERVIWSGFARILEIESEQYGTFLTENFGKNDWRRQITLL